MGKRQAMTEEQWLACREPAQLIRWVRDYRRSFRLLGVAFARPLVVVVQKRHPRTDLNGLLDAAERFADAAITRDQFLEIAVAARRLLPALRGKLGGDKWREVIAVMNWRLSDVFAMLTYEAVDARWSAIMLSREV